MLQATLNGLLLQQKGLFQGEKSKPENLTEGKQLNTYHLTALLAWVK